MTVLETKNLFQCGNITCVCWGRPELLFYVGQGCQEQGVYFSKITLNSHMSLHSVSRRSDTERKERERERGKREAEFYSI